MYPAIKEIETKNRNLNKINNRINALKNVEYVKDYSGKILSFCIMSYVFLMFTLLFRKISITIIGIIVAYWYYSNHYKDDNQNRQNRIRTEYQRLEGIKEKMTTELYDCIERNYGWITNLLHEQHAYTFCVEKLIMYIKSGRADNLKEALNLYEIELHQMRMEQKMNNMMQEIQEQNRQIYALRAEMALTRMAAQSAAESAEYVASHY